MSYIYKITNKINGLSYIGNTSFDIQKRWREHCKDAKKDRCKGRPLYTAMNEYGVENFTISVIEECDSNKSDEKEAFWIDKLKTYENGYNDTMGGVGKPQVDYDMVVSVYNSTRNQRETARILNISRWSVHDILKKKSVESYSTTEAAVSQMRPVVACDESGIPIIGFLSAKAAAKWVCDNHQGCKTRQEYMRTNIQKACSGKHKQAYGYIWKYADNLHEQ